MASGALPPGFPAVEIDGEFYWDGGLDLEHAARNGSSTTEPRQDTLAFQVDLWSARGELPRNLAEVATRQKEIQYSSRTRANTDQFKRAQRLRNTPRHSARQAARRAAAPPRCRLLSRSPTTRSTTSSS